MRAIVTVVALPLALVALACGKQERRAAADDLSKDLELASASTPELASSAQRFQHTQVISVIEQTPGYERAPAPVPKKRVARRTPRATEVAEAKQPEPEVVPIQAPVTVADATPQPVPAPEPTAGPRPTPVPVTYPGGGGATSTGGRGTDIGTAIGTIIGVVIRGGVVDGDHCDPRGTVGRRGGQPGDFPFPVAGVPLG